MGGVYENTCTGLYVRHEFTEPIQECEFNTLPTTLYISMIGWLTDL